MLKLPVDDLPRHALHRGCGVAALLRRLPDRAAEGVRLVVGVRALGRVETHEAVSVVGVPHATQRIDWQALATGADAAAVRVRIGKDAGLQHPVRRDAGTGEGGLLDLGEVMPRVTVRLDDADLDQRALAVRPHRIAGTRTFDLADLAGDDLLLPKKGHCLRDQALSLCANAGQGRLATSLETLWNMIAAGEGYSVFSALGTSGQEGLAGLVAARPLADATAGRTVAMAWRRTDPRGAEVLGFAAMLRSRLPEGIMVP